ncbi:hypothetical protein IA935_02335 [Listeria marthii]|uniref:hypothetical protein n=1 Tax=Listeria marthii TaxID=529731 RepID=UPI001889492E|nr:hypothetical protein [Listeria marthii]MBF2348090.1 hypothetical protein [Listeria marthii]
MFNSLFASEELTSAKMKHKKYEDLIKKVNYVQTQIENARMCAIDLDSIGWLDTNYEPNMLIDDKTRLVLEMAREMRKKQDNQLEDLYDLKSSAQNKLYSCALEINQLEAEENES